MSRSSNHGAEAFMETSDWKRSLEKLPFLKRSDLVIRVDGTHFFRLGFGNWTRRMEK